MWEAVARPWGEAEERLRRLEERLGAARLGVLVVEREVEGVRDEGPRNLGEQALTQPAQRLWQLLHRHVRGGVARVPRGRPAAARRGDRLALGDDVIARRTVDERLPRVADERARAHDRLVRRHCHVAVEGEGFSAVVLSNALAQSRQGLGRRREDAVWYREPKRRRNGGGVFQSDLAVDLAVAQPPRTSAVWRPARALANLLPALVSADLGAAVHVRVAAGPLKGASDKATFVDVAARVGIPSVALECASGKRAFVHVTLRRAPLAVAVLHAILHAAAVH